MRLAFSCFFRLSNILTSDLGFDKVGGIGVRYVSVCLVAFGIRAFPFVAVWYMSVFAL